MKHSNHRDHASHSGPRPEAVRFEFTHPTATAVYIAGSFNDWNTQAKPMHSMGGGRWLKESALPPGTYEYLLVVDGKWMPDPLARESVPNPFGGRNSLLKVVASPEPSLPANAHHSS